jgi:multisubunit Na+/H+ antiporter MnhB subunit
MALSLLVHATAVGALVLATRQALDTDTTRALAVCAGAIGVGLALLFLLGIFLLGRSAT